MTHSGIKQLGTTSVRIFEEKMSPGRSEASSALVLCGSETSRVTLHRNTSILDYTISSLYLTDRSDVSHNCPECLHLFDIHADVDSVHCQLSPSNPKAEFPISRPRWFSCLCNRRRAPLLLTRSSRTDHHAKDVCRWRTTTYAVLRILTEICRRFRENPSPDRGFAVQGVPNFSI